MEKDRIVHLHSGVVLGYKEGSVSVIVGKWMHLEMVILSEVSQTKRLNITQLTLYENFELQII